MDPEPTPLTGQPAPTPAVAKPSWIPYLVTALVTALVAGGGVYAYTRHQNTTDQQNLQAQIDSLKSQLASASPTPTATATPTASATPSASPTATSTSCANHLSAVLESGSGAAGTYYYTATLTNTGTQNCTLTSQSPTLVPIDASGNELGKVVTAVGEPPVKNLTLAPSGKVYTNLGFPNSGNFDLNADCKAMKDLRLDLDGGNIHVTIKNIDTYSPTYTKYFCKSTLSASAITEATP